jgi:hypothetical protein
MQLQSNTTAKHPSMEHKDVESVERSPMFVQARSRGLYARVQFLKTFLFDLEHGLKVRDYEHTQPFQPDASMGT